MSIFLGTSANFRINFYVILLLCYLKDAKINGASVSVETCPHYFALIAEEIIDGNTRFKCAPPIREEANRQKLWDSLLVLPPLCCTFDCIC